MATKTVTIDDTFVWVGSDKKGTKVKGESTGTSAALIKAELRRRGIKPTKVRKKPKPLFGGAKGKKITPGDIAIFTRQLSTMMSAGVPLVQSFDIAGRGHENPRMQDLLLSVKTEIESGSTMAESLAKHPYYFDELYCSLVHAGEQAGILEALLDKVATYKEKVEAIKSKIKKAMFYPASIIVVSVIVTAILLIFVIPQFESLFQGFGADLPVLTQVVIDASKLLQEYWYVFFGVIIGSVFALIQLKRRSVKFNHMLDRTLLKLPIIGPILNKAAIARFARTLSTMFAAGVPLNEAMESVAGATGNIVYSNAVMIMKDEVTTGQQLNIAMRQSGLFPNMVVQMAAIGEEAGSVDAMMAKVADIYEQEVDDAVDALSSLMEPLIMVVLGTLIGGMVIAMYLPIFKLGTVI